MKGLLTIFALIITISAVNAQDYYMIDDVEDSFTTESFSDANNDFRIESPGAWGARAHNGNCAEELQENFDRMFPEGVEIGKNANVLVFTSAEAVSNFLPTAGPLKSIPTTTIDPTSRELRSSFIAKVLALKLSIRMDQANRDFSNSDHKLAKCIIKDGLFEGTSVARFLDICEAAIGGETTAVPVLLIEKQLNRLCNNYAPGQISQDLLIPVEQKI